MDISPFKGHRYNSEVVGDLGSCVSPPYDVIDPDQRDRLHRASSFNIAHIIKGVEKPGDNGTDNVYTRAGTAFRDYLAQGALQRDSQESIYVYAQDFTIGSVAYRRTGFVALGKLESYGEVIKPHEKTLDGPKADRLNLMRATQSQIGQVFMLYSDPDRIIDHVLVQACGTKELLAHTDEDGIVHRLYAVTDPEQVATIVDVMRDKSVFIADGHHRYETALNYYNETKNPAAEYCMMTFVNTHNEGLIVLPTHRLIKNVPDFSVPRLLGRMKEYFDVARLAYDDIVGKKERLQVMFTAMKFDCDENRHAIGMYFNDGAFYVATLREDTIMAQLAGDHSTAWRELDIAILHKLVLENMLSIDDAALAAQTNVEYIKDFGGATMCAIDRVDEEQAQGLFFLNTTKPGQVEAVAMAGEKMPQKSTFFHPKIFSGLVVNVLS